jgi:rhodanese-related sulfurtransferase
MVGTSSRLLRTLAVLGGVLAIAAPFAGSPYAEHHGHIDVDALARAVVHEDDHVTAIELAGWIKERRQGLRVIDVRSAPEFDAYHVPTAERITLDSLVTTPFRSNETIVLYSEGGAHAAQAWVFLRALGYERVFFLRGGLFEWLDEVMDPALPPSASAKDSVAFARVASVSRYFGGTPHSGPRSVLDDALPVPAHHADTAAATAHAPVASSTAGLVLKVRRRGC